MLSRLPLTVQSFSFVAPLAALLMVGTAPIALAQSEAQNGAQNDDADQTVEDLDNEPMAEVPLVLASEDAVSAEPVWSTELASELIVTINTLDKEGLRPADYKPAQLEAAIASGPSAALDVEATRILTWLIEDLRDGRTPMVSRKQWFVVDPDSDAMPTKKLIAETLESGDLAALIKKLTPTHADYAALKTELAKTPATDKAKRMLIMANMDRWRWLGRDLGPDYLRTNVPEYMLRFVVNKQQIATYRTVVGKAGATETPQLAEKVEGVIFNPTWTVPQSIVKGEGLGAKVLANPTWAKSMGYKATKGAGGHVTVVQQPGPRNALGMMKLHMPNPHAIFLHDTPSRGLFAQANRALSHGCIRTERALELAMVMAYVLGDVPTAESQRIVKSLEYRLVPVKRQLPVYITYFTMATDIDGKMRGFTDIYKRDKPVFDAMAAPRPIRAGKMKSTEEVIAIQAPGA